METAHQVGRISVSTAPDVPYKEMARHCEALLMGKQQKMSNVMIIQQKQESGKNFTLQIHEPEVKKMSSYPQVDVGYYGVLSCSSKLELSTYLHDI